MRLVAVLVCGLLVFCGTAESAAKGKKGGAKLVRQVKGGRLTRNGDFYVLHLKGTWYEMGMAHGLLLLSQVEVNTVGVWRERIVPMVGEETAKQLRTMALGLRPMLAEEVREELRGLADGSGVPLEEIELAALMGGPMNFQTGRGVEGGGANPIRPNCSSLAAFGKATKDGNLIYTHNFDFEMGLGVHDRPLVAAYESEDGQRFCTLGWAGILFAITGLNESQISVGCIGATSAAERPDGLPMGLIVRKVLQEAEDLDDVEAIVKGARRMCGFNYVAGDGKVPEGRVLETNAERVAVFGPNQRSKDDPEWMLHVADAVFRADTAMDPAVRRTQTCTKGNPSTPELESPVGSGAYDSRYKVMGDLLQKWHGKTDLAVGIKIMQATAMPKSNMQSFVCDSSAMVFRVAVAKGEATAYKREYVKFDFEELFGESK